MKKKIVIQFFGPWVLRHRNDDVMPVRNISEKLADAFHGNLEIKTSVTSITLILDDGVVKAGDVQDKVGEFFSKHYPDDSFNDVITINTYDYEVQETEKQNNDDSVEKRAQDIAEDIEEELKKQQAVLSKINALVGVDEFKKLANEIALIAPELIRNKSIETFTYQSYIFSINDGNGLSTYLQLLGDLIEVTNIGKIAWHGVKEVKLAPVKDSMEPFSEVLSEFRSKSENLHILCIDISEWMNATDNRFFREFLKTLERNTSKFIFIFRVPFVDKDVLDNLKYSLNDLMFIRDVSFPPFTKDELRKFAESDLNNYGFQMTSSAWPPFFNRILEEKSDGKFYGLNTVKKVVRELLYKKQLYNSIHEKSEKKILKRDTLELCANGENSLTGREELAKLVGSENIANRIEEILAQIDLAVKSNADRPCIHMRFVGNPGTGKTTVARIIGKILKENGVLRVGNFYEYAGRDFCGRYIGETAPKTASMCRDAYGSVMFIDEAYSLYKGEGDSKDFGREALDTLIAEMENHRNDFVVIMAGYTDEMETLMKGNSGLASRMPYVIEFPNFTRDQLYNIYQSMLKGKFKYSKDILSTAKEYFDNIPDEILNSKEFSNARFVRNLFERTWAKAAMRCQLEKKREVTLTKDDFERSVADKEFMFNTKKKTRIGF